MFLANSEQMSGLFKEAGKAMLDAAESREQQVRDLFRRALIRDPDAEELAHAVAFLESDVQSSRLPSSAATGQLLWAIVSGPEFLTNH
jgi:NAD(P)-dependent dehydrogenase (short-subunit alcohol dehydrogenase family)